MASPEAIPNPAAELEPTARSQRKRILWTLVVLLLLLVLALTPPLVSVNRLRRRIAASMSASLGRPVHLDSVRLNILPVPGFTLQNLVVSEDPAFGYEPVIRANEVDVTLRPSSLWRRQVEFSTIRFIEPSLNLVRNARGEWNIESLLMHAASVDSAPTAQRKAGPEPRFPYIEATNGRVNIKLGQVKQPFSLVDADFAVWLPSSKQWNVRLHARPARTDINLNDAGSVRLEGSLDRAPRMEDAGVHLQGSWHDAQLGEASRLFTGSDAGWRGSLNVEASLNGTLRHADLTTALHANDVRRSDFLPAQLLDLSLQCSAAADTLRAGLADLDCRLPVDDAEPVRFTATALDAANVRPAATALHIQALPLHTVLNWARMFSQRIPAEMNPKGTVSGEVLWNGTPQAGASPPEVAGWSGGLQISLPNSSSSGSENASPAAHPPQVVPLLVTHTSDAGPVLQLPPVALHAPSASPEPAQLLLSGFATRSGYTLNLTGTATAEQVIDLSKVFPPFSDGVETALPHALTAPSVAGAVNVTCTRSWPAPQTCVSAASVPSLRQRKGIRRHS